MTNGDTAELGGGAFRAAHGPSRHRPGMRVVSLTREAARPDHASAAGSA